MRIAGVTIRRIFSGMITSDGKGRHEHPESRRVPDAGRSERVTLAETVPPDPTNPPRRRADRDHHVGETAKQSDGAH